MSDLVAIKRALISVSDKTGLAEFASALHKEFGVQLISTGGTAKFLRDVGLPVMDVSEVTGFPEMMDGRVKTLHPKIHGGLLALRDNPQHVASMKEHKIDAIDLVVINLYPFKKTIEKPGVTFEEAIENIDIGGPSMVRSASKNHHFVTVVTDPAQYEKVLGDLRQHGGSTCGKHRLKLAQKAFAHTAEYDALIAQYLADQVSGGEAATGSGPAIRAAIPTSGVVATATAFVDFPGQTEHESRAALRSRLKSAAALPLDKSLHDLCTIMALVVGATEAAAFSITGVNESAVVLQQAHIRPDDSTPQMRSQALKAFEDMTTRCLQARKEGGVINVTAPGDADLSQFCLIVLLRTPQGIPFAAANMICRTVDKQASQRRYDLLRLVADYYEILMSNSKALGADRLNIALRKQSTLRYGENPHQTASLYVDKKPDEASVAFAEQLHGKELSYINLLDADAALSAVKEFNKPAACVVKHATPCGCASASDLATAFVNAYNGDPLAAFGGIVAVNRPIDLATAQKIVEGQKFLEVIVAPSYNDDALALLKDRWKNCRLLAVGEVKPIVKNDSEPVAMHKIVGGYLVQERDWTGLNESDWKVVSERKPTDQEMNDLRAAWLICKHIKSNAIVIAKDGAAVGIGGGQVDRVNASRVAIQKAADRAKGAVAASDAFFPFPDGPELLLNAGVTALIHPGGSVRDNETIAVANQRGAVVILTGQRHFRH